MIGCRVVIEVIEGRCVGGAGTRREREKDRNAQDTTLTWRRTGTSTQRDTERHREGERGREREGERGREREREVD